MSARPPLRRATLVAVPVVVFALASLLCLPSGASATSPQVTVSDAWARATPPRASTAAVYLTLLSVGGDRLVSVSTPVAQQAALHRTTNEGGVMRMRPVAGGLALPAGKPVSLSPGGYHIMLMGLRSQLHPGESVPLHLTFARSGPVDANAAVRPLGADAGSMPGMSMN